MASGFDSTALNTGLLNSITQHQQQQQALAQHDQQSGDAAQYQAFQEASKEYDTAKAKQKDDAVKIEALANVISGGKPDPAAYSTARDAVELGYTSQEHLPYVMDTYKATQKDLAENPAKWSGQNFSNPPQAVPPQDTNPNQTNILRKFGNQTPIEDVENVRQHNLDRPYQNLPGAQWGKEEDTANRIAASKAKAAVGGQMGAFGYDVGPDGTFTASGNTPAPINHQAPAPQVSQQPNQGALAPQSSATPQGAAPPQSNSPLSIPDSALSQMPPPGQAQPASNAGISLSGPPPEQPGATPPAPTNSAPAAPAPAPTQQQPPAAALPQPQQPIANVKSPDSYPITAPTQLGSAVNFDALEQSGALHAQALEKLTPADQAYVRSVAAGLRQPPPPYAGARSPHTQMIIEALNQYDPTYSDGRFAERNKFLQGPEATNLRNLNTSYNHMGLLAEAAGQVSQNDLPAINRIANALGVQEGKSAPVVFDNIKHYVSSEMRRFYTNGHGGLAELEQISSSIDKSQSPQQINDVMGSNLKLLDGAGDSYDNQYREIMGNMYEPKAFLSKTAQGVRDQLMQSTNAGPNPTKSSTVAPQTQDVLSKFGLQ